MADGFKVADAYVELTLDKDRLNTELDGALADIPRRSGPDADRSGRGLGDKLSQGMRMSLIRNSPLIVAAIAAGLTAGGPLLATAATGLFAAVGIVAAAQAEKVQQSWLGAWGQIKAGAISDSKPIQDVLVSLATTVADRFQGMRGSLRGIFEEAAPQIAVFSGGLLDLVENSLPGFYRVIAAGMPVTQGFADFLGKVGTGFSDLFDRLATRAPALGLVWSQLGDTFATLLPLLGELVGQGAELATHVLPLLNGSLGLILDVTTALGPMLPFVVAGFTGMKIAGVVAPMIDKVGTAFSKVQKSVGGIDRPLTSVAGGMNLLKSGAGGVVNMLGGPWGVALAGASVLLLELSQAFQAADAKQKSWTDALLAGGDAADQAAQEYQRIRDSEPFEWMADLDEFTGLHASLEEAQRDAQAYLRSLTPLERAQHDVKVAQTELSDAVEKHGPMSRQAADAAAELSDAQREAARIANEEEAAIRGVTEAMIEQIDQARALVDKQFAMEDALKDVAKLTEDYTTAVREHGRSSQEAADALDALERGYRDAGRAASDLASSGLPASVDDQTRALFGARAELAYYRDLLAQGIDLPPELDTYVALLERQAGGALSAAAAQDILAAAIGDLGVAVKEVPGEKAVTIKGEGTEELRAKLDELGFKVERLPSGEYKITADDIDSENALASLMANLATVDTTTATPEVILSGTVMFYTDIAAMEASLLGLDGESANPEARLDSDVGVKTQTDVTLLDLLGGTRANPTAMLGDSVPGQVQTSLASLYTLDDFFAEPQAGMDDSQLRGTHASDLGLLQFLAGQRPTPFASIDDSSLRGIYNSDVGFLTTLHGQRPTPIAGMNSGPFASVLGWLGAQIDWVNRQRPSPVATLYASTGAAEAALNYAARSRTATVYLRQMGATVATGGKIGDVADVWRSAARFADGGSPGGKLLGAGGPTEDRIPAVGPGGVPLRLSATEWIIKAISAGRYGDRRMAAVNDGTATILLPGEELPMRRAAGGPLSRVGDRLDGLRDRMAEMRDRTSAAVEPTIRVDNLTLKVETPLNLMSPADLRKAAQILRAALIGLDREGS